MFIHLMVRVSSQTFLSKHWVCLYVSFPTLTTTAQTLMQAPSLSLFDSELAHKAQGDALSIPPNLTYKHKKKKKSKI